MSANDQVEVPPQPAQVDGAKVPVTFQYSCKKCRHVLFRHEDIVPHDTSVDAKGNKAFGRKGQPDTRTMDRGCTSYFLDPDASPWVAEESRELHASATTASANSFHVDDAAASAAATVVDPDTIYCTKCRTKIGAQHWVGSQCSCGAWITPAFKIHCKAIDKMPVWA